MATTRSSAQSLLLGDFECSYDPTAILDELWKELQSAMETGQAAKRLSSMARASGITEISSSRTCLTCLSNCPTNVLPCDSLQHTICEKCLRRFDDVDDSMSTVVVNQCPLGCRLKGSPWTIRLKPETAGARILSLDG